MDGLDLLRYFAALLLVLGLLGGFLFIVRRGWVPGLPSIANLRGPRVERRLEMKDSLVLDARRRLVIVRADDEDHVILLGPERDTLIKTGPAKEDPVFEPEMPTNALPGTEADSDEPERREASA